MARKKKAPEHENLERWLVSYADFITLLFAFFVVMYSISSVNEGKYRVLSDSLVAAFRAPTKTLQPIQVGESSKSPASSKFQIRQSPFAVDLPEMPLPWVKYKDSNSESKSTDTSQGAGASKTGPEAGGAIDEMLKKLMEQGELNVSAQGAAAISEKLKALIGGKDAQNQTTGAAAGEGLSQDQVVVMRKIASEVQQAMQKMIDENLIAVRRTQLWVEVEIKASVLFASGDASVNPNAIPVLAQLAKILKPFPNVIRVEGFTDNIPIKNSVYPSNWELSSARAASVVRLFINRGVAPPRLLAVGYGKYHPIADNATAAGRQRNRRVVLVVLATRAKAKSVQDDVQVKDRGAQGELTSAEEDKGIQTPEESQSPAAGNERSPVAPVQTQAVGVSGTVTGGTVPTPTVTVPSTPHAVPTEPVPTPFSARPNGVIHRPPGLPVPSNEPPGAAIPAPIQVRPPIDLSPPLLLPVPISPPRLSPTQSGQMTP